MRLSDFDYELPSELIAQKPLLDRSCSRLLLLNNKTGDIKHDNFFHLSNYLMKGDVLVLNNTKVNPARINGEKRSTKAKIELLLLGESEGIHEAMVRPARRVSIGDIIDFEGVLTAHCVALGEEGIRYFRLEYVGFLPTILDKIGRMPLPPYIHTTLMDQNRYQTVYAKHQGSAAAPTAGLHFTDELLLELRSRGIKIVFVTLHVGLGTFKGVTEEDILKHKMHSEHCSIDISAVEELNLAKKEQRRIIAVGTTSLRTLESCYDDGFKPTSRDTDLFIYPGYKFKTVDALITNFHLPKSTLLMLVSAFASKEMIFKAYREAIDNKYRFFSFGDAMMIGDIK